MQWTSLGMVAIPNYYPGETKKLTHAACATLAGFILSLMPRRSQNVFSAAARNLS